MRILSSLLLALGTCLTTTVAQVPVTLTGRIEVAPSTPCDPTATHRLGCTDILLRSSTVNLSTFVNRMVDIHATTVSVAPCVVLEVTDAVNAPNSTSTLSLGGYRLNSTVVFTTPAPIGALVLYFFSCEPGFLPLGDFGTLQLNPLTDFIYWTLDVSISVALRSVRIPNDPILIGQTALFQTAMVEVAPTLAVKVLNAGCFKIQN